ncbi:MAG TPA: GNAT family N-acetyltransferase [Terriglobales bacterium]|nr:GNAT family N-acetyltransferase [Terriglobales bacterium]
MVLSADLDSGLDAAEALSRLHPTNPFCTSSYLQAMRARSAQAWTLTLRDEHGVRDACLCHLLVGRVNRSLIIPSLPALAAEPAFWEEVARQCRSLRVSRLELNTYCSPAMTIPAVQGESRRRTRFEYFVDMRGGDLWTVLHENHRRRVRKAAKAGLELRCEAGDAACSEHAKLMASSMERRTERGEEVPTQFALRSFKPLLQSGAGRLYQAVRGAQIISSVLLLLSSQGAYLHSGGTGPEGMELGASHWLHHELMKQLTAEGKLIYNLGGTEDDSSGLALFKARFGAQVRQLQAVEAFPGNSLRSRLSLLARRLEDGSRQLRQAASRKRGGSPSPVGGAGKQEGA